MGFAHVGAGVQDAGIPRPWVCAPSQFDDRVEVFLRHSDGRANFSESTCQRPYSGVGAILIYRTVLRRGCVQLGYSGLEASVADKTFYV